MSELPKPDKTKAEYIYRIIKGSLSTIPIVGGAVYRIVYESTLITWK